MQLCSVWPSGPLRSGAFPPPVARQSFTRAACPSQVDAQTHGNKELSQCALHLGSRRIYVSPWHRGSPGTQQVRERLVNPAWKNGRFSAGFYSFSNQQQTKMHFSVRIWMSNALRDLALSFSVRKREKNCDYNKEGEPCCSLMWVCAQLQSLIRITAWYCSFHIYCYDTNVEQPQIVSYPLGFLSLPRGPLFLGDPEAGKHESNLT